jgi:hypothetical protein
MPLPTALPFGLRDIKLTPFTTPAATAYGTPVDLPYSRTLSFSEAESFEELRGDDSLVAIHGSGANVEWELESGGISLPAWAVLSGGAVVESGLTPNIVLTYDKLVTTEKPYFKIEGQVISDSGGDMHCIIYKAKVNDALEGEFAEGSFFLTSCSGVGVASTVAADLNKIYSFIQNETAVEIATP